MLGIGIDIGSTATKVVALDEGGELLSSEVMPTGYSSVDAAERAREASRAHSQDIGRDRGPRQIEGPER